MRVGVVVRVDQAGEVRLVLTGLEVAGESGELVVPLEPREARRLAGLLVAASDAADEAPGPAH